MGWINASMASKELNNRAGPKLAASTIIVHGHGVGLSSNNVPTSESRTMELFWVHAHQAAQLS